MMTEKRNQGIDLLRIILMAMICTHHVLFHGGILSGNLSGIKVFISGLIETMCLCSVNGYALISGYCSKKKTYNLKRIIQHWFTALFYSLGIGVAFEALYQLTGLGIHLETNDIIHLFFPVSYGNWYFKAYFAVFFFVPLINLATDRISEENCKRVLVMFFIVFSISSLVNDNWFNYGYSAFWLLCLFVMGSLIKKADVLSKCKDSTLSLMFFSSCALNYYLSFVLNNKQWSHYTSPLVLLSAISLLVLFSKKKINSRIVERISSLTFGIYLFHDNKYVRIVFIEGLFSYMNNYAPFFFTIIILFVSLAVFLISAIVEYFRSILFDYFKVEKVIDKVAVSAEELVSKMSGRI